jgi:hypothetical protein
MCQLGSYTGRGAHYFAGDANPGQAERRLAQNLGTRGSAFATPDDTGLDTAGGAVPPRRVIACRGPVEAEPVRDCGRFPRPATGDPHLGQEPRDIDAARHGGDEQLLTDLPVGSAGGDQHENLGLPRVSPSEAATRWPQLGNS